MKPRLWIPLSAIGVVVLFVALLFSLPSPAPTKSVAWRRQPDQFPLGTVLQDSRVEMTLGAFCDLKPPPLPRVISRLPSPFPKIAEWVAEGFRQVKTRSQWSIRVESPDFLRVDQARIKFHTSQGPFAFVSFSLNTTRLGPCSGNLIIHLSSTTYGATNILVPVRATVLPKPNVKLRRVLISETPYECYATGNGSDFEPLAGLVGRLAKKGIVMDFHRQLPRALSSYSTILVAGDTLALLTSTESARLKKFVSEGGRLILAADAFFVPTAPKANELLADYGLEVVNQDAGHGVTNSSIAPDPLTAGVKQLEFWRPAAIKIGDPAQAKTLVGADDFRSGFVAVSRHTARGEVVIVTQSLWWNWIRSNPTNCDNCLLLENLLSN